MKDGKFKKIHIKIFKEFGMIPVLAELDYGDGDIRKQWALIFPDYLMN